jgi:hypothetical protein
MNLKEVGVEVVGWMQLAWDVTKWQSLVITIKFLSFVRDREFSD